MSFRILVMGLSGSGKTTLSTELVKTLNAECINADTLRKKHNDWDFSLEGRLRQAERVKGLSLNSENECVIMDFICPLEKCRAIVNADYTVWMDTVSSSKYSDTDKVFENPEEVSRQLLHIKSHDNMGRIVELVKDAYEYFKEK